MKKSLVEKSIRQRRKTTDASNNENQRRTNRRRLLGVLGAGSSVAFMPPSWHQPIVQSVILPVHAQTSLSGSSPVFLSCGGFIALRQPPFSVIGCQQDTTVQPTVTGSISGNGDLSGVTVNVQSSLSIASNSPISFSTTTDAAGNYSASPNGGQGHTICTVGSVADNVGSTCTNPDTTFTVTITATPVGYPDQVAQCSATFTCGDVQAAHEGGSQDQDER